MLTRCSQTLNEIMPMIYRRFTEKSAEEWRQIYKALQLLEFLIKHGSERVIDDARGHITLLKMLRQFHFIDQNGKDQGINVRNRAKELTELLGDVERIRSERKKARATKTKYTGVEGGAFAGGSSSRYGGFGSESAGYGGGFSGGVYGDGGGFGGQSDDYGESTQGRSDNFEEYDEFEEGDRPARQTRRTERPAAAKQPEAPKKKEPEVDLFSFDEPATTSAPAPAAPIQSSGLADLAGGSTAPAADDDDEFDDFQSAPTASAASFAAPQPVSATQQTNISNLMSSASPAPAAAAGPNYSSFSTPMTATPAAAPAPTQAQAPKPTTFQPSGPNYFGNVQSTQGSSASTPAATATPSGPSSMASMRPVVSNKPAAPAAAGGDAFGALWGKASGGIKKTETTAGPAMGQLAKEKSAAGIWGAPASTNSNGAGSGSASGDLLG